ncbi:MAG: S-methyl-5'-thioadenosine phosphorylase [Desulfobacterota bacterium]|nr:S-methyl-5'-thioadenosine phosphorylase [Thermodesulfobacteriota bacterium]
MIKIGIIGGTGFGRADIVTNRAEIKVHTPYGAPSDLVTTGEIEGVPVINIPRHGRHHNIYPSAVNYRANIWAMKKLGATHILAVTAVGSLREEIEPGHLVFPDQFIDRTTRRIATFYEGQEVCHIPMADPFCERLRTLLGATAARLGIPNHPRGTVVTIEGPRFSTRAESKMYRMWGADIINMSTVPEVVLAREAGICYATIAMSTDYDCWHESREPVSWELIQTVMHRNAEQVIALLRAVVGEVDFVRCSCKEMVHGACL